MITIKNVKTLKGTVEDITVESAQDLFIDAEGKLLMLPALIDGHVHFRTPGSEYKEDWITGAKAAIAGGVTTVCDMPNNQPACIELSRLIEKKALIDAQLKKAKIPLRYHLYLGADKDHLEGIGQGKKDSVALKIFMGSSTGGLVMCDEEALHRAFKLAAQENIIVAVHAEDESMIRENTFKHASSTDPKTHSLIRNPEVAASAVKQAISLAETYGTQLFILHVSTKAELDLIRGAKKRALLVYAEATPHHLFLSGKDYEKWGTKVQVNPPIRSQKDQEALWEALLDGTIDTIGSDHAPHTLDEKNQPYGKAPSGVPGIETTLPLLLNAVNEKRLTLENVVALTRMNIENIYNFKHNRDVVLVDMERVKEVKNENLKTKCGWSPYAGKKLKGWPVYTVLNGHCYKVDEEN